MTLAAALSLAAALAVLLAVGLLARQQRRLRRRAIAPHVVLDIADRSGEAVLTVTNVGFGPALEIEAALSFAPHVAAVHEQPRFMPLPERYEARRVLAPGEQLTFPAPGDDRGGRADPGELASRVERIELEVTAYDLDGRVHRLSDVLHDPFRRVEALGHRQLIGSV